jgi:sigma-B regulation protein RsbU (phosphoserine phosphatase)
MHGNMFQLTFAVLNTACVLVVVTYLLIRSGRRMNFGNRPRDTREFLQLSLVFGLFSLYAGFNAMPAFGAVVSLRHIGPMMGGFIAGPLVGVVAGLIGAVDRAVQGGPSMPSAVAACIFAGVFAGLYSQYVKKWRLLTMWEAAIFTVIFEAFASLLTFLVVPDFHEALRIERNVRLPLMVGNAIGAALFVGCVRVLARERDVRKAKEKIENELNVARSIQMSLVPKMFPKTPTWPRCDLFASLRSAREVGGDFYEFFLDGAGRLVFAIGDVSDKGVPAALLMAVCKTLMKGMHEPGLMPGELLQRVNVQLCEENDTLMFVTVFCGVLDFGTGELWFSNAGHNPPLIVRGEREADWLKLPRGFVLGPDGGSKYITEKIVLEPTDALITYTDGVTEAMNRDRQLYSERRLMETVRGALAATPEQTVKLIAESVAAHAGAEPQSDDITILALKYH